MSQRNGAPAAANSGPNSSRMSGVAITAPMTAIGSATTMARLASRPTWSSSARGSRVASSEACGRKALIHTLPSSASANGRRSATP